MDNDRLCDWKRGWTGRKGQIKCTRVRRLDFLSGAVSGKPRKGFKQRRDRYIFKRSLWLPCGEQVVKYKRGRSKTGQGLLWSPGPGDGGSFGCQM